MATLYPPHPDRPPPPIPPDATPPVNPGNGRSSRLPTPQSIPHIHSGSPKIITPAMPEPDRTKKKIIPRPPNVGANPVFRITSVPLLATKEELMNILAEEFHSEEGIIPNISRLLSCPSPYDDRSQTALLEFTPRAPSILLNYLKDKSNKGYMIPLLGGGDITIDMDFYGLTTLYPTNRPIKADIVAVCGLNGHAYGSWSGKADNRGIKRMWLRDFLQEDLPACRTMIYGYDSRLTGAHGLHNIPDYTDVFLEELRKARRAPEENIRPIVFIGHSFGGIIIAEAIVKAKGNIDKYGGLFESTKATIFYATPHRGLVVDDILTMIGNESTRETLVKSLRHRSEGELHNFKNCTTPYGLKIISYKEIEQTRKLIKDENGQWARKGDFFHAVSENSAVFHLPTAIEETLAIEGDHSTLVKFQYKAQSSYTSVLSHLEVCTKDTGVGRYMTAESAIINGSPQDLARVLQVATVDLNVPLKYKERTTTLLHVATLTADVSKVQLLLDKGSNIDACDESGCTALHEAIASHNLEIVELLLRSGARNPRQGYSSDTPNSYELPLLHFACMHGRPEIVEVMLKSGGVGLNDYAGYMNHHPLHFAAMNERSSVLEMLIAEKKVDTEVKSKNGMTALHEAARCGKERNVRLLLLHGADIGARDKNGATPLHTAAAGMNEAVVDVLMERHADMTAMENEDGYTPLHFACMGLNEKLVKKFLDYGADIEIRNQCDMTPLLCAAQNGTTSIFELLVRNQADTTVRDENDRTILHFAAENLEEDMVEHILRYKPDIEIEALDSEKMTPLHTAAVCKNGPAAKSLLRNGASTTAKDEEGNTPLHIAIMEGCYEVVKHLLHYKADIQVRGWGGNTPLHMAAGSGNEKLVGLLLEHRADRRARNYRFSLPIDVAKKERNMDCVRLLKS